MHAQGRRRLAVGAGLMAPAVLTLALLALTPMAVAAPAVAGDPAGDTVTDADDNRIDSPRADIVSTWAEPRGDGIALGLRARQTVEPVSDRNWASDASYVTWELDTTGDGRRDYKIEYSLDGDSKQLMAFVDRFNGDDEPDLTCEPPASFSAETGYAVLVGRKCLGNPATFAYRVTLNYDTNVKDENADVATDHSPDQGWTNPSAPAPGATAPAPRPGSPAPTTPPAPATGTTDTARQGAAAPAAPAPAAQTPSSPASPTPPGSSQVSAAAQVTGSAGASARATATANGSRSQADSATSRPLAIGRIGPERLDQLAWLAAALILADLVFLRVALSRRAVRP